MGVRGSARPASRLHDLREGRRVGGTWRDNTYPGAACDVPSHLYSLLVRAQARLDPPFPAPAGDPRLPRATCVDALRPAPAPPLRHRGRPPPRCDEDAGIWRARRRRGGRAASADVVVAAIGQLNRPRHPRHPRARRVRRHGLPLGPLGPRPRPHRRAGRRHRHRRQRDPVRARDAPSRSARAARSSSARRPASCPKPDGAFTGGPKRGLRRGPGAAAARPRSASTARCEPLAPRFTHATRAAARCVERPSAGTCAQVVPDPELRGRSSRPTTRMGCKRILHLERLVPGAAPAATSSCVDRPRSTEVTRRRRRHRRRHRAPGRHDHLRHRLPGHRVPRADRGSPAATGASLHEAVARRRRGVPRASPSPGSPTCSCSTGPNTNLGHNSIIFMLERQIGYALTCDPPPRRRTALRSVEVTPEAQQRVERPPASAGSARTVWADSCHSWYKTEPGKITNNWSAPTYDYWRPDPSRPHAADFVGPAHRPAPDRPAAPAGPHPGVRRAPDWGRIRPSGAADPGRPEPVRADGSARSRRPAMTTQPVRVAVTGAAGQIGYSLAVPHRQRRDARPGPAGHPPAARDHAGPRRARGRGHGARRLRLPAARRRRADRRRRRGLRRRRLRPAGRRHAPQGGHGARPTCSPPTAPSSPSRARPSPTAPSATSRSSWSATRPTPTPSSP